MLLPTPTPGTGEPLFPPGISKGATGGPSFSTVVAGPTRAETRTGLYELGPFTYETSHAVRTRQAMEELQAFFLVVAAGRWGAYRFKDWLDFTADFEDTRMLSSTTFQLQKAYISGGVTYLRDIAKPVSDVLGDPSATKVTSTVRIFNDGDEVLEGWAVDCSTGVLTFDGAPDYLPQASFEFHTWMRLDTEQMTVSQEQTTIRSWESISHVEVFP